jgi:hypothetical protein
MSAGVAPVADGTARNSTGGGAPASVLLTVAGASLAPASIGAMAGRMGALVHPRASVDKTSARIVVPS